MKSFALRASISHLSMKIQLKEWDKWLLTKYLDSDEWLEHLLVKDKAQAQNGKKRKSELWMLV